MKKLMLLLVSLSALFIFAGCGAKSPKDVAVKWFQAVLDGDVKTANELSTEKTQAMNALMAAAMQAGDKDSDDAKEAQQMLDELKKAEVKIDGDTATLVMDGKDGLTLKKVDGDWKVDFDKE